MTKHFMTHFSSPCLHCGIAHDDVKPGPCEGDPAKAKPIAYASLGVRPDGVERFRIRFSDMRVEERYHHISFHAPYYHFGHSDDLVNPPRFDVRLRQE